MKGGERERERENGLIIYAGKNIYQRYRERLLVLSPTRTTPSNCSADGLGRGQNSFMETIIIIIIIIIITIIIIIIIKPPIKNSEIYTSF
jgi:carbon starvation protein CstA